MTVIQFYTYRKFYNEQFHSVPAVTKQKFRDQATRFFISILINLTFKYLRIGDRNEDLILLLMGFVTLDEKNISGFINDSESVNIVTKHGFDPSPGFRAFLLLLFIRHRLLSSIPAVCCVFLVSYLRLIR